MSGELRAARVRVPCATSNLGAGYDTLGLAFDRYLEASFEPGTGETLVVERSGTLRSLRPDAAPDLVAEAFSSSLMADGITASGILSLSSTIPVARGLGSSAAAVLAGTDLSLAVRDLARADTDVFNAARRREGHGDNAAPCLFGGLQAVVDDRGSQRIVELELSPDVGFAYAAPGATMVTEAARAVLPRQVSHATAVRQLGRVTALVRGLATADGELLRIGVEDELHVPFRLPTIPNGAAALGAGYEAGAWAVTISGAGSGLIAMCEPAAATRVSEAMREAFAADEESVAFVPLPDLEGLVRL